ACDEHLTIRKQRSRLISACGNEAASGCPSPACRIVKFRSRNSGATKTTRDEHLPVRKQRRRMISACGGEAAGDCPCPSRWIVEFRAGEISEAVNTACDEHLAVG